MKWAYSDWRLSSAFCSPISAPFRWMGALRRRQFPGAPFLPIDEQWAPVCRKREQTRLTFGPSCRCLQCPMGERAQPIGQQWTPASQSYILPHFCSFPVSPLWQCIGAAEQASMEESRQLASFGALKGAKVGRPKRRQNERH